jgi:hypothetical protein
MLCDFFLLVPSSRPPFVTDVLILVYLNFIRLRNACLIILMLYHSLR